MSKWWINFASSKTKWMMYTLTPVLSLATIWEKRVETIRRCDARNFQCLYICRFRKCIFRRRASRENKSDGSVFDTYYRDSWNSDSAVSTVIRTMFSRTIISKLSRPGVYLNQKSWIQHSWLCSLNAKHWAYSCADLTQTTKTKREGDFHRRLHLEVQQDDRIFWSISE